VATGSLVVLWILTLAPDAVGLFSLSGWFDREGFLEASRSPADIPRPFTWSLAYLCGENRGAFLAFFWSCAAVAALFTLGVAPRITSVLTWLAVTSLTANPVLEDEADVMFRMLTLYLAVGYVLTGPGRGASWAERALGPWRTFLFARREGEAPPSIGANLALRLVQVHLAVIMASSGLHKLQLSAWWSGVAFWYYLLPPMEQTPARIREMGELGLTWMIFLNLTGYGVLAWQLLFPAFAWRKGWGRVVLLGGAALGWIGLTFLYRMPLFGPALMTACLAFLGESEWQAVRRWIGALRAKTTEPARQPMARRSAAPIGGR
jgi:hypothetical protein